MGALPGDARTREQLEWVADHVLAASGTAVLWHAQPFSAAEERALVTAKSADRAAEYAEITEAAKWPRPRSSTSPGPSSSRVRSRPVCPMMRWVTRAGIHIDRAASAWLIRRFVDPQAESAFVDDPSAVRAEQTPFDMRGVDYYGHHGQDCTFETVLRRRELTDPALWRIATIVHEADLDDERYDAPEAPGLDTALRGLSMVCTDEQVLEHASAIFDGLSEFYRQELLLGREPS